MRRIAIACWLGLAGLGVARSEPERESVADSTGGHAPESEVAAVTAPAPSPSEAASATGLSASETAARAGSPLAFLKAHDADVQKLLSSADSDSLPPRLRARVVEQINSAFDFQELSRRTLGDIWEQRSADERATFVATYRGIVEEQNFDSFVKFYRDGKIQYLSEEVTDSTASVASQIPADREFHDITYQLHRVDGRWRIYDLVIDDVSTADGNHRRYTRYIAKHSYDKLIAQLESQLARLRGQN